MLDFLIGYVDDVTLNGVSLNVNDVGYFLTCSSNTISKLENKEEKVKLYVHMALREDHVSLFGFYTSEERDLFNKLISVPKIGGKVAINLLSVYSVEQIIVYIINNDHQSLAKANGVGKKTSEQIVVNLKDKFKGITLSGDAVLGDNNSINHNLIDEAVQALLTLGFDRNYSMKLISSMETKEDLTIEDIISFALTKAGE